MAMPVKQKKVASDGVIGMLFVLATEAMFFAGLISAYVVNRAGAMAWPPEGQPRLPIEITGVNTAIFIASAFTIFMFGKKLRAGEGSGRYSTTLLKSSIILGVTFLIVQGSEWIRLIGFGLTTHSSIYGAFFYTLIGLHAAHVLVGLILLVYLLASMRKTLSFEVLKNRVTVFSMYWFFVVALWPRLYVLVYLM